MKSSFLVFFLLSLVSFSSFGQADLFYFISDDNNSLYTIDRTDGTVTLIGATGRSGIEAIAYFPIQGSEALYAADGGDFGTLNRTTGAFTLIDEIDNGGTADGTAGAQTLNDVDGLMLDGQTLIMWAVERQSGSTPDLLFQIDLTTGQFVPDAFGVGVDYLEIIGTGINVDVDDLAVDPVTGEIYGVANDNGTGDALIRVNKTTGEFEFVATLAQDDIEGLSFHNDGKLYGSEGDSDNRLSLINKATGAMTNFFSFSPGGDVEGLAALVAPANLIEGNVFEDDDLDGVKDMGETGLANVTIYLYLDQDGDGQVDPEDTRVQSTTTDVNGDYSFNYITTGTLLTTTEYSSYPANYSLTTDNVETMTFTDGINFGETDSDNDFGLGTGSDCDGDGLPDFFEGTGDADGDGILNQCDLDSDNDGILDSVEGTEDFDDDGILNYLDRDSDDDGIPDAIEANGGIRPTEYVASQGNLSGPVGANGIVDTRETAVDSGVMLAPNPDSDGDTYLDYLDLDSDNDGIMDLREAGGTVDTNSDGQVDGIVDANGNGYADALETSPFSIPNTDLFYENSNGQTRRPNYIDIDSDADGIDDTREGLSTVDYRFPNLFGDNDGDGILDFWDVSDGSDPIVPVDTDVDGKPDYTDSNSDNDPESDFIEGNDADNNGTADQTNTGLDANGNGLDDRFDTACTGVVCSSSVSLPDTDTDSEFDFRDFEGVALDTDGDGEPDATDIDDDNDGILDVDESGVLDTDGDGLPNSLDLDSDNDGILDIIEAGGVDTDDDGRVDDDTDTDGDGWADTFDSDNGGTALANPDTDGDSINNFLDLDSDGDGVVDLIESQTTTGTPIIPVGADTDGDGIDNAFDVTGGTPIDPVDTETDGTPDYIDTDSDNDGFADILEAWDTDGDGIANVTPTAGDLDVDGLNNAFDNVIGPNSTTNVYNNEDALDFPDVTTSGLTSERDWREDNAVDSDGDGQINSIDIDDDDDGILDVDEGIEDFDNDGIINSMDLDSDNDGIPDIIEAGGVDTDNDGRVDNNTDTDNDGWADTFDSDNGGTALTEADTDSDGRKNFVDVDSDGDGIVDLIESQVTSGSPNIPSGTDTDLDGLDNTFDTDNGGTPTSPVDTDTDATPDYIDVNSDNDGFADLLEAWDTNGDLTAETVPSGTDTDDDGLDDAFDNIVGPNNTTNASNNETAFSFPDVTTAGNSERDWRESNAADNDFDGIPDVTDIDDDNDGILDTDEGASTDTDGDGIVDRLDLDSDNDGIPDIIEAGGVDTDDDGRVDDDTDTDGDGWADTFDSDNGGVALINPDTDNDGINNYLDLDSDNDGIEDIIEAGGVDTDDDGVVDSATDSDGDGWADTFDSDNAGTALTVPDTDVDGLENYIDIDADGDGIVDLIESQATTGTPIVPVGTDTDGDGIDNAFDSDNGGTPITPVDTDVDLTPDYIDFNSDNDSYADALEGWDTDDDQVANTVPAGLDSDGDGLDDAYDDVVGPNSTTNVYNNEDALDFPDVSTSGQTSERDWREANTLDADFDGIPDGTDIDDDNDGILDVTEGTGDADGDGIPNNLDLDSDNDGIPDILEAGGVDTDNDGRVDVDTDTDGDGWANTFDSDNGGTALPEPDSDNDGIDNYLDLDSDNDGILDVTETNKIDANGDGKIDGFLDTDGDGYDDSVENSVLILANSDLTYENTNGLPNLPNYIDIDSDADGIDDTREGYSTLGYQAPTDFTDTDNDGILDFWDVDSGNSPIDPVDTDGAGLDDYVDSNSDNDSLSDFIEGNDFNEDGVADVANSGVDANGNGLDDAFDENCYGLSMFSTATSYGEEQDDNGSVDTGSSDLEFSNDENDNSSQTVGVYFPNISIPQGEVINSAYIQFQTDEVETGPITITIRGELTANPSTFTTTTDDVSDRLTPGTTASESWTPADWNSTGEASSAQRTVDISSVIEEIVGQVGWSNGNALVILFTGADGNRRTAEVNPTMTINYGSGITFCSSNVALQDSDVDGEKDWRDTNGLEAPTDTDADGIPDITDVDDDNDGILDTDEGCTDTPVLGANASSASEIVARVEDTADGIDGVNANFARFRDDGAVMEVELRSGSIVTAGTEVTVRAQKRDDVASTMTITESTDGVSFVNAIEYSFATDDVYEDKIYTLATNATHIRITYNEVSGDLRVDNVSYPAFTIECTGNDTDSDGIADHLDIDADGDGIVDLIESQLTTGSPVIPVGVDTDGDGLDDAFDSDCAPCGVVTGVPTILTDTDSDTAFDFLDFNSDGDTFSDLLEGWDTDGNLVANIVPSGTDTDGDGLDDAFDLIAGINSTTNVYNTQDANDFPDQTTQGNTERDWREENVADSDFDGIQDSNDIDDDNDGILDTDEGCVSNPASPSGPVVDNSGTGGSLALINDGDLTANNGIILNGVGEYIIVDLGSVIPAGVDVVFTLWRNGNGSDRELRFAQLPDANVDLGNGTNPQTVVRNDIASGGSVTSFTYNLTADTRYIQVEMPVRLGGRIEVVEATIQAYTECQDTDGDGIADYIDLDSDNDGIPDIIEAGGVDTNNDGRVDDNTDTDTDGWANTFDSDNGGTALTNPDTDNDGINDMLDRDSDNDGIEDIIEAGGVDTDDDGAVDSFVDLDGDGWANTFDSDNGGTVLLNPDTDGDGITNNLDIDADGDGIVDLIESQATTGSPVVPGGTDTDSDGIDNAFDTTGGTPTTPVDTDMDGTPDYLDFNSDNDSFLDALEGYDTDGDLVANTLPAGTDTDGDGLDDNYDTVVGPNSTTNAYNNEDANDFPDVTTAAATSERDWREANALDTDLDGEPDATDIDDDNDGILDTDESEVLDSDGDGIVNSLDLDSDNDGIPDIIEAGGVDTDNDGRVDNDTDTDGDGWADTFDSDNGGTALTDADTDADELENRIDVDSDDDGVVDLIESQATTATPVIPVGSDLDGDGIDDAFDVNCTPCGGVTGVPTSIVNTDGTDTPDYIDLDSDNDGLNDVIEAWDTDGDYLPDTTPNGNDNDNDGLDNNFDDVSGPNSTTNVYNSQTSNSFPDVTTAAETSERDWRESNAENCQPGGINSNFLLWLRADQGGTSWRDVSNNYVSVSSVGSFTTGGNVNFNPSNFFGGSSYYNTTLSINADTHPDLAVIVVYQPTIDNSGALWGEDNGGFDRYVLDNNGVNENEAVSNGTGNTADVTGLYSVGTTTISAVLFDEDQANGSTVYLNGLNTQTNFSSDHAVETSNNLQIGGQGDATNRFSGKISEVIVYNSLLTNATDLQQIQGYLALKYGVTLSSDTDGDAIAFEGTEGDYIASNGSTTFWDASDNTTFHNNVAGIGRDDGSCLNQLQSQSENSDAIVAIGLDGDTNGLEASNSLNGSSFTTDFSSLMWGHDGAALHDASNRDFSAIQVDSRLNREWRARETGTVGTVTVRFSVNDLLGPTGVGTNDESQIVLLVDSDGDFTTGAQVISQSFVVADDGFVNFQVDFTDGLYFTLGSLEEAALPITLISFDGSAEQDQVVLRWTTASEFQNSFYRIERSANGLDFETIGFMDGAGTTNDLNDYTFIDREPLEPVNFYRLIDVDNNGIENASEVIRVNYSPRIEAPVLYPNPVQAGADIYIKIPESVIIENLRLIQINGVQVPVQISRERNRAVLKTRYTRQGVYIVTATLNGERHQFKFIVKN
ncbi:MAG: T9SS type A sorting domain-containing protein [Roseivirga sp.]|nr:T9SS type A sorting domain-containing protein [Roseivirga sp.]